ncbi:unnamed protein product [Allacma fusca]|uniref:Uncharacterized protein n=1 Tax=Allacma fusca TaxID=39272 RepID=A0A8J2NJK7_9HEXA|nr:unnamed protein product [Allacma fusca]
MWEVNAGRDNLAKFLVPDTDTQSYNAIGDLFVLGLVRRSRLLSHSLQLNELPWLLTFPSLFFLYCRQSPAFPRSLSQADHHTERRKAVEKAEQQESLLREQNNSMEMRELLEW